MPRGTLEGNPVRSSDHYVLGGRSKKGVRTKEQARGKNGSDLVKDSGIDRSRDPTARDEVPGAKRRY